MNEPNKPSELLDMQQQLQTRLWAGEYYSQGHPIVRLLGDLGIQLYRLTVDEIVE